MTAPSAHGQRCTAVKADGVRCRQSNTVNESGLCLFHDPARQELRRLAQQKGGYRAPVLPAGLPAAPKTLDDVVAYLAWTIDAMGRGSIDKDTGAKMIYGLTSMRGALVQRDLENQVQRLRAELREARKPASARSHA